MTTDVNTKKSCVFDQLRKDVSGLDDFVSDTERRLTLLNEIKKYGVRDDKLIERFYQTGTEYWNFKKEGSKFFDHHVSYFIDESDRIVAVLGDNIIMQRYTDPSIALVYANIFRPTSYSPCNTEFLMKMSNFIHRNCISSGL